MKGEPFYRSIDFVNLLFNKRFNVNERHRQWVPHMPFLFSKSILNDLHSLFAKEYELTSSHRTRAKNDLQLAFTYMHYVAEQPKFNTTVITANRYGLYGYLNNNIYKVRQLLNNMFEAGTFFGHRSQGLWLCINDGMDPTHSDYKLITSFLHEWYELVYPIPSQFEKEPTVGKLMRNEAKYNWPALNDLKRNKTIIVGDFFTEVDSQTLENPSGWLHLLIFKNLLYFIIIPYTLLTLYNSISPKRGRRKKTKSSTFLKPQNIFFKQIYSKVSTQQT